MDQARVAEVGLQRCCLGDLQQQVEGLRRALAVAIDEHRHRNRFVAALASERAEADAADQRVPLGAADAAVRGRTPRLVADDGQRLHRLHEHRVFRAAVQRHRRHRHDRRARLGRLEPAQRTHRSSLQRRVVRRQLREQLGRHFGRQVLVRRTRDCGSDLEQRGAHRLVRRRIAAIAREQRAGEHETVRRVLGRDAVRERQPQLLEACRERLRILDERARLHLGPCDALALVGQRADDLRGGVAPPRLELLDMLALATRSPSRCVLREVDIGALAVEPRPRFVLLLRLERRFVEREVAERGARRSLHGRILGGEVVREHAAELQVLRVASGAQRGEPQRDRRVLRVEDLALRLDEDARRHQHDRFARERAEFPGGNALDRRFVEPERRERLRVGPHHAQPGLARRSLAEHRVDRIAQPANERLERLRANTVRVVGVGDAFGQQRVRAEVGKREHVLDRSEPLARALGAGLRQLGAQPFDLRRGVAVLRALRLGVGSRRLLFLRGCADNRRNGGVERGRACEPNRDEGAEMRHSSSTNRCRAET